MQDEQLTHAIIGCAFRVYNELGFGFIESVYETALILELTKNCLRTETQEPVKVYYDTVEVGHFRFDIRVQGRVLVEVKTVGKLHSVHEKQLINYLSATGHDIGLLINFGPSEVEVRRKYRDLRHLRSDFPSPNPF
jgi:GxxExxY protein